MKRYDTRSNEPEIMDDLTSGGKVIDQTLKELEIINKLLGGNHVTIGAIDQLIDRSQKKIWKIVDIGCGSGDILKRIAKWARKRNIKVELIGIDANPNIVDYAANNCKDFPEITIIVDNIFSASFKKIQCDIITATLFLHHFKDEELVALFTQFREQASTGLAINDLHRHWFAFRSIKLLTSLLSKSEMVRNDAAVSVERGFRSEEVRTLLRFARITDYSLKWMWAFRWQLIVWTEK
jgi:SAM-dependent methyltransferase